MSPHISKDKAEGSSHIAPLRGHKGSGKVFSDSFFRFLLGFTVIVALSFGTLIFLGTQQSAINPEPALSGEVE